MNFTYDLWSMQTIWIQMRPQIMWGLIWDPYWLTLRSYISKLFDENNECLHILQNINDREHLLSGQWIKTPSPVWTPYLFGVFLVLEAGECGPVHDDVDLVPGATSRGLHGRLHLVLAAQVALVVNQAACRCRRCLCRNDNTIQVKYRLNGATLV